MIATIIIVSLALAWLLIESDFLRCNLMGKTLDNTVKLLPQGKDNSILLLDTVHYKPSEFVELDMPETMGNINIVCRRS